MHRSARPTHLFLLLLLMARDCNCDNDSLMLEVLALNAVRRALTCLESKGSPRPLVAMSPPRLLQFHQFQKHSRHEPPCFPMKTGAQAHCNVGKCVGQGICRCFFGFSGDACTVYDGTCWLIYCFLQDCYGADGARLRCVCDPSLYGTGVLSGLYWYPEGLSGSYKPPPPFWKDHVPSQADDGDLESYKLDAAAMPAVPLPYWHHQRGRFNPPHKTPFKSLVQNILVLAGMCVHGVLNLNETYRTSTPLVQLSNQHFEGVDEEIDLSLYQRAVAAATAQKTANGFEPRKTDGVHFRATRQFQRTLRTRITRPDPSLWNKTIISYLMSQISALSKSGKFQKVLMDTPGFRTSLKATSFPVATKSVKNSLERDFGKDLKFVYEDYVPLDEGAVASAAACIILSMPGLSMWIIPLLTIAHYMAILYSALSATSLM